MSLFEFWFRQYHCVFLFLSAVTALGMEDGSITNEQITASSYHKYVPWKGRLNNANGFWIADIYDDTPWIQVAFSSAFTITAIQTQGPALGYEFWVEELQIQTGESERSLSYIMNKGVKAVSIWYKIMVLVYWI